MFLNKYQLKHPKILEGPVLPGNLEGGSCTVPTGLLPLGRLSAEEKNNLQVYPGNYLNTSKVITVEGCHHQHFLSTSTTNNPCGGQE